MSLDEKIAKAKEILEILKDLTDDEKNQVIYLSQVLLEIDFNSYCQFSQV